MQKRRFVVTGGSGFVGNFLIKKLSLLYPDSQIHNLDIHHTGDLNFPNLFKHKIDITNKKSLNSFEFSEEDMIYHLAANSITENTPSKGKREKWFNNLNVGGTKNLLESMETNGVKEMAFISSDMVYGSPRQIPIKVDHPLEPNGPYGQSKKEAENLVTDFGANEEHRTIIFRPRMIVGPGRWGVIKKLFFFIKNSLPIPLIGSGNNHFQLISIYDCVEALIQFNEQNQSSGIYNLGSLNPPKVLDLLKFLIKKTNSKSFLIPTWSKGTRVLLNFLDTVNLTILYPEQFILADQDYILDIESLKENLGFYPRFNDQDILLKAYQSYYGLSKELNT